MNENEDAIFSITIQQASSTYEQEQNVHPPDDYYYSYSSRSQSKSSRNPRNRKNKLQRAKEMLLKGNDLPRSYYMDESLFPDLVDSLQADYKQLVNPKSGTRRNTNQADNSSTQQNQQSNIDNKNKTYNGNMNSSFKSSNNNNLSKTNTNKSVHFATENTNNEYFEEEETVEESEAPDANIRTINTAALKSSEVVYKALKKAQEYYELFIVNKEKEKIQDEIKERLKSAKTEKRELMKMISNQEKNMDIIFTEEENKLIKKHDKQIQEFNEFWESEEKQRTYNKTSDELRLLRRQADLLLMDKQYQQSIQCQKRADELEAAEIRNRTLAMSNDYGESLRKLQEKQNKEMKTLTVRQKMKRTEYCAAKNEEIAKANSKIAKIQLELEKSNDPNFINRIKKSHEMEANSVNSFTASKYKNSGNSKTRNVGPNVVSTRRPAPRSYRNFGKMEVSAADFNAVPLPPLRTDYIIYKTLSSRK